MQLFRGVRQTTGRTDVTVSGDTGETWLVPCPHHPTVSVCPYNWHDHSPGSRRLALAVLVAVGLSERLADMFADDFVRAVVSQFHRDHFAISSLEVYRWICDVVLEDLASRRPPAAETECEG